MSVRRRTRQYNFVIDRYFFFAYNEINNKNSHPDINIEEFCQWQDIAIEFIIYAINYKILAKPNQIFNFKFRLYGVQLLIMKKTLFLPLVRGNVD